MAEKKYAYLTKDFKDSSGKTFYVSSGSEDWYLFRKSYRDEGGLFSVESHYAPNIQNFCLSLGNNSSVLVGGLGNISSFSIFQNRHLSPLTSDIRFAGNGTMDFASSTGAHTIAVNEPTVKLERTKFGTFYNLGASKVGTMINAANIYAAGTLSIEGSFMAELQSVYSSYSPYWEFDQKIETRDWRILFNGSSEQVEGETVMTDFSNDNGISVTALRANDIDIELNMDGKLESKISGLVFSPLKETNVTGNSIQNFGILANGDERSDEGTGGVTPMTGVGSVTIGGTWTKDGKISAVMEGYVGEKATGEMIHIEGGGDIPASIPNTFIPSVEMGSLHFVVDGNPVESTDPDDPAKTISTQYMKPADNPNYASEPETRELRLLVSKDIQQTKEMSVGKTRPNYIYDFTPIATGQVYQVVSSIADLGRIVLINSDGEVAGYITYSDINNVVWRPAGQMHYINPQTDAQNVTTATWSQNYDIATEPTYAFNSTVVTYQRAYETQDSVEGDRKWARWDRYANNGRGAYVECSWAEADKDTEYATYDTPEYLLRADNRFWNKYGDLYSDNKTDISEIPVIYLADTDSKDTQATYTQTPGHVKPGDSTVTNTYAGDYFLPFYEWRQDQVLKDVPTGSTTKETDTSGLLDRDLPLNDLNTVISGNTFESIGIAAQTVTLGDVEEGALIEAKVKDIDLHGEAIIVSGDLDGDQFKEGGLLSKQGEVSFADNTASSSAITAENLTITGTFRGSLQSTVSNLSARKSTVNYTYKWDTSVGENGFLDKFHKFVRDEEYDEANHCYSFGVVTDYGTAVFRRTITQGDDHVDVTGSGEGSVIDVKNYGINLTGALTSKGNVYGELTIATGEKGNNAKTIVSSAETIGVKAGTITVNGGIFGMDIDVDSNVKYVVPFDKSTGKVDQEVAQDNTVTRGIQAYSLTADALSGTINVNSDYDVFFFDNGEEKQDIVMGNSCSVAVQVNKLTNGNDGSLDLIGTISSSAFGIVGGINEGYNLRISGSVSASFYAVWDYQGANNDDTITVAAGGNVSGAFSFKRGKDTLILDSNARVRGDIETDLGTLNLVFLLNESTITTDALKADGKAILTGEVATNSKLLISINTNDAQRGKEYVLVSDDSVEDWPKKIRTLEIKYQGINLSTRNAHTDANGESTVIAQLGYIDKNGTFIVEDHLTDYEFRQNNFTAKVQLYDNSTEVKWGAVRIIDTAADNKVLYQAHTAINETGTKASVVVDVLPDADYLVAPFTKDGKQTMGNLTELYDREKNTFTVGWTDNSDDLSQTTYQLEYYIITYSNDQHTKKVDQTKSIVREVETNTPRTQVTLENIESTQEVVWRVRQTTGSGDVTGEWMTEPAYERPTGLLETKAADTNTYTLSWKNAMGTVGKKYVVEYTVKNSESTPTVITKEVAGNTTTNLSLTVALAEGETITAWNVKLTDGTNTSEAALYQNLQIDREEYAAASGLKAETAANQQIQLSWNNATSSDVSFELTYTIRGEGDTIIETKKVLIDPVDPKTTVVSSPLALLNALDRAKNQSLEWSVRAVQTNGDLTNYGKEASAVTTQKDENGKIVCETKPGPAPVETLGTTVFEWDDEGSTLQDNATYLLEYQVNGKTVQKRIAQDDSGVSYYYDEALGKNRVRFTVKLGATDEVGFRVRRWEQPDPQQPVDAGEWMIYEFENISDMTQGDPINKGTADDPNYWIDLKWTSNVPGSAYQLEYRVIAQNGKFSNPVSVDIAQSDKKNLSYTVVGLNAGETLEWRVAAVEEGIEATKWTYESTLMEKNFSVATFVDKVTDLAAVPGVGDNAVATLSWTPGETTTYGVYTYEVQYFQNANYLSEKAITEYFENSGNAFATLEVTNNAITISALKDLQYIYYRVAAIDMKDNYSEWAVGDPFRVYLNDKNAPVFSFPPESKTTWTSQITTRETPDNLMDVTLSWKKATDDASGVKNYTFAYKRTSGDAKQEEMLRYYYSFDNGSTWTELKDVDGTGTLTVDHKEGVEEYFFKIENLANGNYDWTLDATDNQGHSTIEGSGTRTGTFAGDFIEPVFQEDDNPETNPVATSTQEVTWRGAAGAERKDQTGTLAPMITWKAASDGWTEEGDGNGSGVKEYHLVWTDSAGNEYVVVVDAVANQQEYSYTISPDNGEQEKLKNDTYTWKLYAYDYMGNESVIAEDSTVQGTWIKDEAAPYFAENTQGQYTVEITNYTGLSINKVVTNWDDAIDLWTNDSDVVNEQGVHYYTLSYWNLDENNVRVGDAISVNLSNSEYTLNLKNGDYDFEITATDWVGHTDTDAVLKGKWESQKIEPSKVVAKSYVTFEGKEEREDATLAWDAPLDQITLMYYEVRYREVGSDFDPDTTPWDNTGRILVGFTKDNIQKYRDEGISFTEVAENQWKVNFRDSTKEHLLTYDEATGDYTMSFTLESAGITPHTGTLTYKAETQKYEISYDLADVENYQWQIQTKAWVGNIGEVGTGTWEGDTAAPRFLQGANAVKTTYDFNGRSMLLTVTVDNSEEYVVDDPAEAYDDKTKVGHSKGCGVKEYVLRWKTVGAAEWLNNTIIDNDTPSTTVTVSNDNYIWDMVAIDYVGNTTDTGISGQWDKDSLSPRIVDETISTEGFLKEIMAPSLKWTWTETMDDRVSTQDGEGSGVKSFVFSFAKKENASAESAWLEVIVDGDKLVALDEDTLKRYKYNAETKTYSLTGKDNDGNQYTLVYNADETSADYRTYTVNFGLANDDYSWKLYAIDNVENSAKGTGNQRSGDWTKDSAAPVWTKQSTAKAGKSAIGEGMDTSVSWQGVIDPKTAGGKENDGSGIEEYTFSYRKVGEDDWVEQTFVVDGTPLPANVTLKDGVYTITVANLDITDYEWKLNASDYMDNATESSGIDYTLRSGVWTSDKAVPRFQPLDSGVYFEVTSAMESDSVEEAKTITFTVDWADAIDDWLVDSNDGMGSGVATYTFKYKTDTDTEWKEVTLTSTQTELTVRGISNSEYVEWTLDATDKVGNTTSVAETTLTSKIYGDKTNPAFESEDNSLEYSYDPSSKKVNLTFHWDMADDVDPEDGSLVAGFWKYELSYTLEGAETPTKTVTIKNQDITTYSFNDLIFEKDGVYSWKVTAYDYVGNSVVLNGSDTFHVDSLAPEGTFPNIGIAPVVDTVYQTVTEYVHPVWESYEVLTDLKVSFDLTNTMTDDTPPISYEVRTYGKGNSGEEVRNHVFTVSADMMTANEQKLILSDEMNYCVGYLANLKDNTIYWQVRAIDAVGNKTEWYDGKTFQLIDIYGKTLNDTTAPSQVTITSAVDNLESGLLSIDWSDAADLFGVDHYKINVYDQTGKILLDTYLKWNTSSIDLLDATRDNPLLYQTLENGNYMFSVSAVDCVGNIGKESAKLAVTFDTEAPIFDPMSVTVDPIQQNASFTWTAMRDNLAVGWYDLTITRTATGGIQTFTHITDTEYLWNTEFSGEFSYELRAYDLHGNTAEDVAMGTFEIHAENPYYYDWDAAPVTRSVGVGNVKDICILTFGNPSKVTLTVDGIENWNGGKKPGVSVAIYDSATNKKIQSFSLKVGQIKTLDYLWNATGSDNAQYRVEVTPKDNATITEYKITASKEEFSEANTADDTAALAKANEKYHVTIPGDQENVSITPVVGEWVGFGDTIDYRLVKVTASGAYTFSLNGLSNPVSFKVLQMQANGKLKTLASGTSKGADLTLKELLLDAANEYYISVDIKNANKGKTSDYDVLVNGTAFIKANTEDDTAKQVKDNGDYHVTIPGDQENVSITPVVGEWVGFGDTIDYRLVKVTTSGRYTFSLNGLSNPVSFKVLQMQANGKLKTLASGTSKGADLTLKELLLDAANEYYISVDIKNANKGKTSDYDVLVNGTAFVKADPSHLTWETAEEIADPAFSKVGWVGYGDASDWYTFSVDDSETGTYTFQVTGADAKEAKLTVCRANYDKYGNEIKPTTLKSITVNANGTATISGLNLYDGDFYVQVSSADNGKGVKNTDYTLTVTQSSVNGKLAGELSDDRTSETFTIDTLSLASKAKVKYVFTTLDKTASLIYTDERFDQFSVSIFDSQNNKLKKIKADALQADTTYYMEITNKAKTAVDMVDLGFDLAYSGAVTEPVAFESFASASCASPLTEDPVEFNSDTTAFGSAADSTLNLWKEEEKQSASGLLLA